MGFQELLAALGFGGFAVDDVVVLQLVLLGAAILLFVASLVMGFIAFRAAFAADRARVDAQTSYSAAKDLAAEVRHLTAQMESAAKRYAAVAPSDHAKRDAAETPEIEPASKEAAKSLEAAKEAATVPSALLGRFRPRRESHH